MVFTCVVHTRDVYMVHVHGAFTWCMYMARVHGASTCSVYMVGVHGGCTWCMYLGCTWSVHDLRSIHLILVLIRIISNLFHLELSLCVRHVSFYCESHFKFKLELYLQIELELSRGIGAAHWECVLEPSVQCPKVKSMTTTPFYLSV